MGMVVVIAVELANDIRGQSSVVAREMDGFICACMISVIAVSVQERFQLTIFMAG